MSLFADPATHAANPPESWQVTQPSHRVWVLTTASGIGTLEMFRTKREALEAKRSGFLVDLYNDEARWYAGEQVKNWRPWAELAPLASTNGR